MYLWFIASLIAANAPPSPTPIPIDPSTLDPTKIATDPNVTGLFLNGTPLATMLYVVLIVLLFTIVALLVITGIFMKSMMKMSKTISDLTVAVEKSFERFKSYKTIVEHYKDSVEMLVDEIKNNTDTMSKNQQDFAMHISNSLSNVQKSVEVMVASCKLKGGN